MSKKLDLSEKNNRTKLCRAADKIVASKNWKEFLAYSRLPGGQVVNIIGHFYDYGQKIEEEGMVDLNSEKSIVKQIFGEDKSDSYVDDLINGSDVFFSMFEKSDNPITPEEKAMSKAIKEKKKKGEQLTLEEEEFDKNKESYRERKYGDPETLKNFLKTVKDSVDYTESLRKKRKEEADKEAKKEAKLKEERKKHMIKAHSEKSKFEKDVDKIYKKLKPGIKKGDKENNKGICEEFEKGVVELLKKTKYFKDKVKEWPDRYAKQYKLK